VTKLFTDINCLEEMLALHRGQGWDLFWRDHFQCPTEEEYVQMVKDSKYSATTSGSWITTHKMLRDRGTIADCSAIDDGVRHH
jgi:hypothetical protein